MLGVLDKRAIFGSSSSNFVVFIKKNVFNHTEECDMLESYLECTKCLNYIHLVAIFSETTTFSIILVFNIWCCLIGSRIVARPFITVP